MNANGGSSLARAGTIDVNGRIRCECEVLHIVANHLTHLSSDLAGVGDRDDGFPLPHDQLEQRIAVELRRQSRDADFDILQGWHPYRLTHADRGEDRGVVAEIMWLLAYEAGRLGLGDAIPNQSKRVFAAAAEEAA